MFKFTIDRSKWLHGEGTTDSFLLRPSDGKMCCIGFYVLACGASEKDINGKRAMKERVPKDESRQFLPSARVPNLTFDIQSGDIRFLDRAYSDNDSRSISDKKREQFIIDDLKGLGAEVEFIGEY